MGGGYGKRSKWEEGFCWTGYAMELSYGDWDGIKEVNWRCIEERSYVGGGEGVRELDG